MSFLSNNFIVNISPGDKIIILQNSLNINVGGFKVRFFQKAMTEGKLLWINLSDLLLSLEFSSEIDAKQALANLSSAIEQLLPNHLNASGDKHFAFNQTVSSNTWIINHNLGKYPTIAVTDSGGNVLIPDSIIYTSINSLTVTFTNPETGTIYCN
jgi:hypothetical protein